MVTSRLGSAVPFLLTLGFLILQTAYSQTQVRTAIPVLKQQPAVQIAKELSREFPNATIQTDAEFGIVKQLSGRVAVPAAKTPSEAAQLFLTKYKRYFSNTPRFDEFRQIHEVKSLTGTSLGFARLHAGFPVIDDLLSVFVDKRMTIIQINNSFTPIRKPLQATPLRVNKAHAVQTALTALGEQQYVVAQPAAVLSVVVLNEMAVAVWKVTFKTRKPAASWQVLVDAKSNQVIAKRNVAVYSSK